MIHATILGRLGRDPELKQLDNGAVLNFSLATDHGFGERKETMWIRCAIFGKRADTLAKYLEKGSQVLVVGELFTRTWEKKDGTMATELECRVSELEFAGSKGERQDSAPQQRGAPAPSRQPSGGGIDQDDVPFASHERGWIV